MIVTVASLLSGGSAERTTFSIVGEFPSAVDRVTRYCRYRRAGLLIVVPVTSANADHDPSGIAVVPVLVWKVPTVVFSGTLSVAVSVFHVVPSASRTREVNVHGVLNGPMRTQSTESEASVLVLSFAANDTFPPVVNVCVVLFTFVPSM